jgi:urease accessory protein UreF
VDEAWLFPVIKIGPKTMLEQSDLTIPTAHEILGELHPFAERLGCPPGLSGLTSAPAFPIQFGPVDGLPALRHFLQKYYSEILIACELPAIHRAYGHASRSEIRELIAADAELSLDPALQPFAGASQYVGTAQLKRLRPLRDQRLVQRYLHAVETGEAHGWHTMVYGLILSVYSLPLRPGLINYGRQTIGSFITSANFSLKLLEVERRELHENFCLGLPQAVESILKDNAALTPQIS